MTIVDGMRWRERLRRVGIRLNGIRFQFHPTSIQSLFIDQQSGHRAMFASSVQVSRGVSKTSVKPAHNACHGASA